MKPTAYFTDLRVAMPTALFTDLRVGMPTAFFGAFKGCDAYGTGDSVPRKPPGLRHLRGKQPTAYFRGTFTDLIGKEPMAYFRDYVPLY